MKFGQPNTRIAGNETKPFDTVIGMNPRWGERYSGRHAINR
ncbi:hypothetical protein HNP40_002027 [Mycobacteroides chelonae]|nr:hypothetical protein [Mycobacteroides chelonae]